MNAFETPNGTSSVPNCRPCASPEFLASFKPDNVPVAVLVECMFSHVKDKSYECKTCKQIYRSNPGHGNLKTHCKQAHTSSWRGDLALEVERRQQQSSLATYYPTTDNCRSLMDSIELIVMGKHPFSLIEDPLVRKHSTLKPVSRKTLMQGMHRLLGGLRRKIVELLPDNFGLMSDGWTSGTGAHLLGVMATYYNRTKDCAELMLLGMNELVDPTNQSANNHIASYQALLESYNKSIDDVLFLVADNTSVNKCSAERMDVRFVGCALHLLSRATLAFVQPYMEILEKVHAVLVKLKNSNNLRAKLKRRTDKTPTISPRIRWNWASIETTSYLEMEEVLRTYAHEIGGAELSAMVLTEGEVAMLTELSNSLYEFQNATIYLQANDCNFEQCRLIFDSLLNRFPDSAELRPYLEMYGQRVFDPAFSAGVTKVQRGDTHTFTLDEMDAVEPLKLLMGPVEPQPDPFTAAEEEAMTAVERAVRMHKRARTAENQMLQLDLTCIPRTTAALEREFSQAKLVLRDHRKRMSMNNLEMVHMLRYHRALWDPRWLQPSMDDDTVALPEDGTEDTIVPDLDSDSDSDDEDLNSYIYSDTDDM